MCDDKKDLTYTLIRSKRRTCLIQVRGADIIVRVPMRTSQAKIDAFVKEHWDWAVSRVEKNIKNNGGVPEKLTAEELADLTARAKILIPERVAFYAERMGVQYGTITIRHQRRRWGSCNADGDLSFNCLLLLTPPEALDSVVVHELCHCLQLNHSKAFYREVYKYYPDYDEWHQWFNNHGNMLLGRLP